MKTNRIQPDAESTPELEKLLDMGFRPTNVRIADVVQVYENGDMRVLYDVQYDRIIKKYEVKTE